MTLSGDYDPRSTCGIPASGAGRNINPLSYSESRLLLPESVIQELLSFASASQSANSPSSSKLL